MLDGRFEILRVLGEGGWATVYLARQLHVERRVALKVLTLKTDDAAMLEAFFERFQREAAAAARIHHPNIVAVHDVGLLRERGEPQPYIVMDYLEGHDLAHELAQRGPLQLERALRLLLPVVDALAEAHRCDIVHRDLKPANLFLTAPGTAAERLVVVDFGIARVGGHASRLTEGASLFGTPAYLSPEWIEKRHASPAMDVYQLGLILVEMLSGEPVVQDELLYQCLRRHVAGRLELPEAVMGGALGPLLRRALALDPQVRYRDAGALHAALLEALEALALGHLHPRRGSSPSPCVATHPAERLERQTTPAHAPAELLIVPSSESIIVTAPMGAHPLDLVIDLDEAAPEEEEDAAPPQHEPPALRIHAQGHFATLGPSPLRAAPSTLHWPPWPALGAALLLVLALCAAVALVVAASPHEDGAEAEAGVTHAASADRATPPPSRTGHLELAQPAVLAGALDAAQPSAAPATLAAGTALVPRAVALGPLERALQRGSLAGTRGSLPAAGAADAVAPSPRPRSASSRGRRLPILP